MFGFEKYDVIYNKIGYLIRVKSGITCSHIFCHYNTKIKVDSYDSLHVEKTLALHVLIHIKSVLNKDQNHYYYNIFLKKCSFQLAKKNGNFDSITMMRFDQTKSSKRKILWGKKKKYLGY